MSAADQAHVVGICLPAGAVSGRLNAEEAPMTSTSTCPMSSTPSSTQVNTAVCDAMDTRIMQIECGFTRGFAGMQLLGNTSEVCRDGKERARVALESLGINIPPRRLVVSLSPADVKKDGNQFDLPVAVSLALLLTERTPVISPVNWLFAAELGLSGELRPVKGAVSFAVAAMAAGLAGVVVAPENYQEVALTVGLSPHDSSLLQVLGLPNLKAVLAWIFGDVKPEIQAAAVATTETVQGIGPNFDDMILHPKLELAAVTACAGMHSMLLRGAPGTGKSMLAARLVSILPDLRRDQHIEALRIHSMVSERLPAPLLAGRPPYRAPHHQASAAALIGGSETPGELALAHGGVLFLDELPEYRRDLLEALREPLEVGEVRVSRAKRKVVWKAGVVRVAACNNCPCGWAGSTRRECRCGGNRLVAYQQRLSGPILDRIDLHINVPEHRAESAAVFVDLDQGQASKQTQRLQRIVQQARHIALQRNSQFGVEFNRDLPPQTLVAASGLPHGDFAALVNSIIPRTASSRAVVRCLRVARTLADLRSQPVLERADIEQAWSWQAEPAARDRGEMVHGLA